MKHLILSTVFLNCIFIARSQIIDPTYVDARLVDLTEIFHEEFLSEKNEALSSLVGSAEIVLIGEQHHGDGNAFEIKTRLIEYLHKHHGFDVILFETDFYGGFEVFQQSDRKKAIEDFRKTIFQFWSKSSQMNSFWQLLEREHAISVGGFDVHHFSKYSKSTLVRQIDSLLTNSELELVDSPSYLTFRQTLKDLLAYRQPKDSTSRYNFFEVLTNLQTDLVDKGIPSDHFSIQEISNIGRAAQFLWDNSYRDKGMAENIIWLKEHHFKGRKIVVWAQNAHIFKEVESWYKGIPGLNSVYEGFENKEMGIAMGSILSKRYGKKLKSLGMISYGGSYSSKSFLNDFNSIEQINGADYKGLAKQLHERGLIYGLLPIDIQNSQIFNGILLNASGHNFESKANWGNIFDAIIFVDEIKPIKLD